MADVQGLINAIPDAQDGNVITSDYHNTIKAALQAIAGQLGTGSSGQTVTIALQPVFLPVPGSPAWGISLGFAADAGPPLSNGWIPLNLPDGAVIQKLVVLGAKTNTGVKGFVSLLIFPIGSTGSTTLILVDLTPGGNPFTLTGTPNVPGLNPTALRSAETVDNSQFKYALQAEVISPTGAAAGSVTINALQVVYTTP